MADQESNAEQPVELSDAQAEGIAAASNSAIDQGKQAAAERYDAAMAAANGALQTGLIAASIQTASGATSTTGKLTKRGGTNPFD